LGIFRASDPRIAQDKPRGQVTAKELLDIGATRIEKEFRSEPDLQIELLGLTSDIYSNLGEEERYKTVQKRRTELARARYGPRHNLARKEESLGLYESAEATYEKAETQIRRTVGEGDSMFWLARGYHARLLHMRGRRERALALFEETLRMIPPVWKTNTFDQWFREIYAERLAAAGRARAAVPLLESVHRTYAARPQYDYDLREVRKKLGDAYDGAGRPVDARAMLKSSRDDYVAKEAADSEWALKARERWGRFLLEHTRPGEA